MSISKLTNIDPGDISLEHMNDDEYKTFLFSPLPPKDIKTKLRIKIKLIKEKIQLKIIYYQLWREIHDEDPRGAIKEIEFLRKNCTILPTVHKIP